LKHDAHLDPPDPQPQDPQALITLAMLVAMARPHEIAVHVRGAIANGVSKKSSPS